MRRKPSAPAVSRKRRTELAADSVAKLETRLAELSSTIDQPESDLKSLERRLSEAKQRLRNLELEGQGATNYAKVMAGRAKAGKANTDRLAVMFKKYDTFTAWHMQVAEALREAEARALSAGRSSGALSGQAGDGLGNVVTFRSHEGKLVELDEDAFGAIGVAGVSASGADHWSHAPTTRRADGRKAAPPPTFKAKGIKPVQRGGDGGMAEIADAMRRERRALHAFVLAAADAAGNGWAGLAVAWCCVRIIRSNDCAETLVENVLHGRKAKRRRMLKTSMAAGLEACAPVLGFH